MPQRIAANLPALGTVAIDFHRESSEVMDYLGDGERRRLRDVAHLGVAATVFTGINHSRLEYALLQCAVISLVAKLHKDDEELSLGTPVKLNGVRSKVSSGEELLKCWSLLSNYGHAQFTYGVERSLLQFAREEDSFKQWLTRSTRIQDLREWCELAVNDYRDDAVHFLLALKRLQYGKPYDRRKSRYAHYIRNLLLPGPDLFPEDPTARYKMSRLQLLYGKVRLLSMVTLDSYYSGHPLRLQLGAAINNLAGLSTLDGPTGGFDRLIRGTAAWLADELYQHPEAVAAQREYEVRALEALPDRFEAALKRSRADRLLRELLFDGLGKPRPGILQPLIRLSFEEPRQRLLASNDMYETLCDLEGELCAPPATHASIDRNRFSGTVHLDLLWRRNEAEPADIQDVFVKLRVWLTRAVEADALAQLRALFPGNVRKGEGEQRLRMLRRRAIERRLLQDDHLLPQIFWSILNYVLPEGHSGRVSEFLSDDSKASPLAARLHDSTGEVFDYVLPRLDAEIAKGPPHVPVDRIQELVALRRVAAASKAPLLIICAEKFIVRDQYGKHQVEWDGVMVEIDDGQVWITVVEAKNTNSRSSNETQAFRQLERTRDLLRTKYSLRYRRRRLSGIGAKIRFCLAGAPR